MSEASEQLRRSIHAFRKSGDAFDIFDCLLKVEQELIRIENYVKCSQCQSLFPNESLLEHAKVKNADVCRLPCPVCECRLVVRESTEKFSPEDWNDK